jgi:RNA polymerase sigma factor (TIGR02999 family)
MIAMTRLLRSKRCASMFRTDCGASRRGLHEEISPHPDIDARRNQRWRIVDNLPEPMDASHGTDELTELRSGRRDTLDRLMPVVYDQLRVIARRQLGLREHGATLSTTGLVHEAYLKLVDQSRIAFRDRAHFFALASVAMRHVLVDRAKARLAQKRDGGLRRVTLDDEQIPDDDQPEAMLDLNDAVDRLSAVAPRLGRVVECRFFGGLSDEETAEALGVTTRTVQRDWVKAKMLLRRALAT